MRKVRRTSGLPLLSGKSKEIMNGNNHYREVKDKRCGGTGVNIIEPDDTVGTTDGAIHRWKNK